MKNISNNNNSTREAGTDSIPGTSTSDNCKDGSSSKSNNDGVCDVNDMLQNMSTADYKDVIVSVCANCGKEGHDINNICNKYKKATYCNAVCKKVHKKKHKKECEEYVRLAAERAIELHDEELFKQPPPENGECLICFLRLPLVNAGRRYQTCCGKTICSGCYYAPVYDNQGNEVDSRKCPYCRTPFPESEKEVVKRTMKRMEMNDAIAFYNLGCYYNSGMLPQHGFSQDITKALKLYHRAGELGYSKAYCNVGIAYNNGQGVEMDKKKAHHYYELAAIGGDVEARHNLGIDEEDAGNIDRALKHHMIASRDGFLASLKEIKQFYTNGQVSKDDYTKALQAYQEYLGEIKSTQRDEAAAASDEFHYY